MKIEDFPATFDYQRVNGVSWIICITCTAIKICVCVGLHMDWLERCSRSSNSMFVKRQQLDGWFEITLANRG